MKYEEKRIRKLLLAIKFYYGEDKPKPRYGSWYDFNIPNVSIIHLDIEGFELIALRGAQETIKKWKPMIAVEDLGNSENYGYSIDVLESFLNQFGYHEYLPYGSERMYSCRERIVK